MSNAIAATIQPEPVQYRPQWNDAVYQATKLFNLALAPQALRDAPELTPLRPSLLDHEPGLLWVSVGRHKTFQDDLASDDGGTVTLLDHMLQGWLMGHGAAEGESVLLTWDDHWGHPPN